jgi:Flp pilus assembly protein TadG
MFATLRSPSAALRRHLKTRTRGQSLVELALLLPVFMLFFAAILDLGRIAAAQVAVQNAAREGAFQAAETPTSFDSTTGCPAGAATNKVYCRIKLESSGGVTINPSDVTVTCNPVDCSTGLGNTVTVRVNGHFRLLTPLMGAFFGGNQNVTFTAQSVTNRETLPTSGSNPVSTPTPTATSTSTSTATATATPTPTACVLPSAGFTYSYSAANKKAPQAITFTDTSTSVTGCAIDNWAWKSTNSAGIVLWTSTQQNPGTFNYVLAGTYYVELQVHNAAGQWVSTGAVQIIVKP